MKRITRFHHLFAVALVLLSGCNSGRNKAVVSGNVSYQGEPVQDGLLRFVPIEGTKGPASGAVIKDGTYTAKAIGGVPLGKLRVEIRGFRKPANGSRREGPDQAFKPDAREQYLPPKYNINSELTVTIEPGDKVVRNFDLK